MGEPIERIVGDTLARRPDVLSAYAASTGFDVTTQPDFGQLPSTINVAGNHWRGALLLGVTVPLYDGGMRRALQDQAHADEVRNASTEAYNAAPE